MKAAVDVVALLRAQADALSMQARTLRAQADALDMQARALRTQADALDVQARTLRAQADALDVQARTLRAQADALDAGGVIAQRTPRYATSKANPLGSARAFLDAGRRKNFPTFKCGREVWAFWTEVETWIESRKIAPRERKPGDDADDDRARLIGAGLRFAPANGRAGRR
ncbi:hypothetical protein [Sorangium sp. So ce145]|uniref:hypothetical protein n=1 Tax=Sorangium sp. So ce145 TaxID=3133285 RepID=UPI003F644CFF